ncbi:MAG TPA: hypothetical protein IAC74_01835 [Candidatus Aphodoplasma excrementigallinarum]|uniref:Uncharacterized protein n=1 Tax=Candidatus Aphodoplasma excrementigallinarum TaxID=2840673 RepID=A0A9D1NGQ6_9FIRM|nr:hypothetical protein [Candidatus Aphodoplasma excrementigallinarum]
MGIEEYKITNFKKPVSALADTPQMSADELKAWFDSNTTDELKTSVNGIIDAVLDMEAETADIAEALNGKVDKESGKGLSENDYTDEEKQKVASILTDVTALETNTTLIQNSGGGFAAGTDAAADTGAAVGRKAWTGDGGAVGYLAYAANGGGSAGKNANSDAGGAVGANTKAGAGFAGGSGAKAVNSSNNGIDAIQLGTGINNTPKTLQVYGYQLLDANGYIPKERLSGENDGFEAGDGASAGAGGAVGKDAKATGGFAGGQQATSASGQGAAVGYYAQASMGGAVGANTFSTSGGAVGHEAASASGGAVGDHAFAGGGGAVGVYAKVGEGFAGGAKAKAVDSSDNGIDAIQLGTGTNNTAKTLQVYGYQLLDADGKIPDERLNDAPSDGNTYARKDGAWTNLTRQIGKQLINFVPLEYDGSDVTDLDNLPSGITIVNYADGPGYGGYMVMTSLEGSGYGYQIKISIEGLSYRYNNGTWGAWSSIG